jgi:hypothetical protein
MQDISGAAWRKSSYSGSGNACVEVADLPGGTAVRDSKLGDASPVLSVTAPQWSALIAGVRAGELD